MSEKSDTWLLPCPLFYVINLSLCQANGFHHLFAFDRVDGGHTAASVLDGGDPRLPPPAQFRACVFLSVSLALPLLQRLAAGGERPDSLRRASGRLARVRCRGE